MSFGAALELDTNTRDSGGALPPEPSCARSTAGSSSPTPTLAEEIGTYIQRSNCRCLHLWLRLYLYVYVCTECFFSRLIFHRCQAEPIVVDAIFLASPRCGLPNMTVILRATVSATCPKPSFFSNCGSRPWICAPHFSLTPPADAPEPTLEAEVAFHLASDDV